MFRPCCRWWDWQKNTSHFQDSSPAENSSASQVYDAIRVIGEITKEKLDILREADFIFRDEIAKAHLEGTMSQYFAVLTNMRSVGVMGDGRTYDYTLALRSVTTTDLF